MDIKVGTFNLNNLFSRWNFRAEIEERPATMTFSYTFEAGDYKVRSFRGRLVSAKDPEDRTRIADRVKAMDVDVLAVQEVEDIETLRQFARDDLGGMYRYGVLVEGNDPRLIDLGVLSKLPIGAVGSFQHAVHPQDPNTPVFGRDLLEVEILNPTRSRTLFTLYNNHLKSHYVPPDAHSHSRRKRGPRRQTPRRQYLRRGPTDSRSQVSQPGTSSTTRSGCHPLWGTSCRMPG